MNAKCKCGKILRPGYIRCSKCEKNMTAAPDAAQAKLNTLEQLIADISHPNMRMLVADLEAERTARKALVKALETCLKYADSGVAAVTAELAAERVARKALEEALWRANRECCQVGHTHSDQHDHDAPCPVEARIVAALTLASKLP